MERNKKKQLMLTSSNHRRMAYSLRIARKLSSKSSQLFSPVNLAFDLSLIAFYDFIFVSC